MNGIKYMVCNLILKEESFTDGKLKRDFITHGAKLDSPLHTAEEQTWTDLVTGGAFY